MPHQFGHNLATIGRSGDVEKRQLIRALEIVALGLRHRITRVSERDKPNPLDHAAIVDVKTRNDSFSKHKKKCHAKSQRHTQSSPSLLVNLLCAFASSFAPLREILAIAFSSPRSSLACAIPRPDSSPDET